MTAIAKKIVGIDARLISQTGVGTYIYNLLYYLHELGPSEFNFVVFMRPEDRTSISLTKKTFTIIETEVLWHSLKEQTEFVRILNKQQLDLMHFTYFSYPFFFRKPFIVTIHDLTQLTHATGRASTRNPLLYQMKRLGYRFLLYRSLQGAKKIIVPSYFVKDQFFNFFGEKYAKKIQVTYEGVHIKLQNALTKKPEHIPNKPFYVYIGNFHPHKNVERLLKAIKKSETKYSLVLCGPDDFFAQRIRQLVKHLNLEEQVGMLHKASHGEVAYLYKHAKALIYPSLSEGFGLPLVEAAYFGCPALASDIPVFHELIGDKLITFNPHDSNDIADKISSFEQDAEIENHNNSEPEMFKQKFSFKHMAEKTLEIYEQYT